MSEVLKQKFWNVSDFKRNFYNMSDFELITLKGVRFCEKVIYF